jgi:phosphate starvation-inducible protein PhoH
VTRSSEGSGLMPAQTRTGAKPGAKPATQRAEISFDDNRLLPLLYGEHDTHLLRIEHQLGVSLASRGNTVTVKGAAEAVEQAQLVLETLWQRLSQGQGVTGADIDGVIRMLRDAPAGGGAPLRGRTLAHSFVILDEAQNTTVMQMRMALTRMGEASRMVITGDISQIDLRPGDKSGLVDALEILDGTEGIRIVRFTDRDVVRHPLVARIVRAYEAADSARKPQP